MFSGSARSALAVAVAIGFGWLGVSTGAAGSNPSGEGPTLSPGVVVVDHVDPTAVDATTVPLPEFRDGLSRSLRQRTSSLTSSAEVGQFVACFDDAIPGEIAAVVERALARWDEALLVSGPSIEIDVFWTEIGTSRTLAASGPALFVADVALPNPEARYPAALANELLGVDHTPRQRCADQGLADVVLYINRGFGGGEPSWHLGEEPAPDDLIDLETVLLHEVGHGLGIVGSASRGNSGTLRWPHDGGLPYIYETLLRSCTPDAADPCSVENSEPVVVEDQTPEVLANLSRAPTALTNDDLWSANPNTPLLRLQAPPTWSTGSSLSHLREGTYPNGTSFSLMTPFVGRGEFHRSVDHATLALLQGIGWPVAAAPTTPRLLAPVAGNAEVGLAVEPIDLELTTAPSGYLVEVWRDDELERIEAVGSMPATLTGLTNGSRYSFTVRAVSAAGTSAPTDRTEPVRPLELPPFSTAESFVNQLFDGLLDRTPTPAELDRWGSEARSAHDLGSVMAAIGAEPEAERKRQITRLYLGFFGRQPDQGGYEFWAERGAAGVPLEEIARHFATASEFEQGESVGDEAFVTATYQRVLGRQPDAGGLAYWVAQLSNGLHRGRLLVLFSESPEHVASAGPASHVTVAYEALLHRLPTGDEVARWTPAVAEAGTTPLFTHLAEHPDLSAS